MGRPEEAREQLDRALAFPYEFDIRNFLGAFHNPKERRELLDSLASAGLDQNAVAVADTET